MLSEPDESLHPAVKVGMAFARRTMNKYYSKTDLSSVYRIAIALHPGLEFDYFEVKQWKRRWINDAKDLLRTTYDKYVTKYYKAGCLIWFFSGF
ncbi:hypothetical protein PC9H_010246 [Pleurotus ostreatus]|uniref:Uncharacterized protein n=2 Tax=Pleurotus ostreatus TaxID=5322 RepID=A0A8H6ZP88_PLEOS|nr:uncharacterized protein PC9H_011218 [Pleurotus ostreatus]XP_036629129.1 uncharacterized protein PC9H_010246 [Pleurotus ostreatus]KAF7423054.1 hypothetical protein PC9H_011218 [Pleurotus ostreatus]KAF7424935.1 hypothetical protein PC9H_010246 [Pleurotus ostreatus]